MTAIAKPHTLNLDTHRYLDIAASRRIRPRLNIVVTDRAYNPPAHDPLRDWVSSVAAPAFKILNSRRDGLPIGAFAAIGTGTGIDALAGIEILGAETVGITDLFPEVVAAAAANIRQNLQDGVPLKLLAEAGDLLTPLLPHGQRFDVIYENLPNLPVDDAALIEIDRTSAAFVPPRPEKVPAFIQDWLLVLHYLALTQARNALAPHGSVISTLGGRVPLTVLTDMANAAGLRPSFLTYWWKEQADATDVIGSYAQWQRQGLGPFHFYPVDLLRDAFAGLDPEQAGRDALAIERDIAGKRLDAISAWNAFLRGDRIGHTVAVLKSDLE